MERFQIPKVHVTFAFSRCLLRIVYSVFPSSVKISTGIHVSLGWDLNHDLALTSVKDTGHYW